MVILGECKRSNLCVDCDDPECFRAGDIGADCPKVVCDNGAVLDCENCEFILEYLSQIRLAER